MTSIKSHIKNLLPGETWKWLHNTRAYVALTSYRSGARKAEERVRQKKEPLNVLFFVLYESMWKYDYLFQLMLRDANFNPMILVCPVANNGKEYMQKSMRQCATYFEQKGYPCVRAYDEKTDSYVDPMQYELDIIFFTRPYETEVDSRYWRDRFKDTLTCYVNYLYVSNNEPWSCANYFHQSLWRYYLEYPALLKQINEFLSPYGLNGRVVGYPLFDVFWMHKVSDKDWPISGKRRKRIIWAPHFSITAHTGINAFSTFEQYYDFMPKLAEKYRDEIEIVFKPHPVLKSSLYTDERWGKERTDAYYAQWANGENTAFVDGAYVGLFLSSDAMIHDCHSFTVEYLAVNKPAMFLDSGKTDNQLNGAGKEARACYYKGYSAKDIERFICDVVLGGKDELNEKRAAFAKEYIEAPNGKLAAENIIDDLLKSLGRKC